MTPAERKRWEAGLKRRGLSLYAEPDPKVSRAHLEALAQTAGAIVAAVVVGSIIALLVTIGIRELIGLVF